MTDYEQRCRALEIEIEELKETIEGLNNEFAKADWIPHPDLKLTPTETLIVQLLLRRSYATKEQLHTWMYGLGGDIEIKIVDVFMSKIRKKLKPYGFKIETIWGQGYRMPKETMQGLISLDYKVIVDA